ncbi:MAG: Trp biosynthesis-associated membrane protein, partial [Actinomycetota bacterium]|nr:Trp biosynthesis-associated membrane protein [Actinomycetota bacterium]
MSRRALVPLLVVLGAAGIAGGALPRWWTVHWTHPLLGTQTATFTGRQLSPALFALALVALAGIGAVAAAHGPLRRTIGALLAAVGALTVVTVVSALSSIPSALVREVNPQVERI